MIIRLDLNSDEALYIQLMNQIKYGVANGHLKPDEKLPSVRGLASELGINMHTVSKAYNLLKDEGILIVNRSKGVRVSTKVLGQLNSDFEEQLEKKLKEIVYESTVNGVSKEEVINKMTSIFDELGGK